MIGGAATGTAGTTATAVGNKISHGISKLEKYVKKPWKIKNTPVAKIQKIAFKENLQYGTLSKGTHAGQGFKVTWGGDRLMQYHPGGGHHGSQSYWKISSGQNGTVRIFNE